MQTFSFCHFSLHKISPGMYSIPFQSLNVTVICSPTTTIYSTNQEFESTISALHCEYSIVCYQNSEDKIWDRRRWTKMSILSTAGSGKFSSDRTIGQYANEIGQYNILYEISQRSSCLVFVFHPMPFIGIPK